LDASTLVAIQAGRQRREMLGDAKLGAAREELQTG
jgi:hypothetical protein